MYLFFFEDVAVKIKKNHKNSIVSTRDGSQYDHDHHGSWPNFRFKNLPSKYYHSGVTFPALLSYVVIFSYAETPNMHDACWATRTQCITIAKACKIFATINDRDKCPQCMKLSTATSYLFVSFLFTLEILSRKTIKVLWFLVNFLGTSLNSKLKFIPSSVKSRNCGVVTHGSQVEQVCRRRIGEKERRVASRARRQGGVPEALSPWCEGNTREV